MRPWTILLIIGSLGLIFAACGDATDGESAAPDGGGSGQRASITAIGPGISISEAKASGLEGPLLVNGFLLVTDGRPEICDSLAETSPPSCDGDRLQVQGLDTSALDGLQAQGNIQWSSDRMQLLGSVNGVSLVVSSLQQS